MRNAEIAVHRRVSVFICGVQKGGTTSLYAHFCEHPELSPPRIKETHFFDDEHVQWDAEVDYGPLHELYEPRDDGRLRFDATPIYSFWPPSMERIRRYNPDARIIVLFRDPFERAYSQWAMEYNRGDEALRFGDAIRNGRDRLTGLSETAREKRIFSYLERGFYGEQVQRILEIFPQDQVLFLRSDDLKGEHERTLRSISSFLGITDFPRTGPKQEHRRPRLEIDCPPTASDLALFQAVLRDDLTLFAKITGLDISAWPTMGPA